MDISMTWRYCYMILTIRNHATKNAIEKEVLWIVSGLFLDCGPKGPQVIESGSHGMSEIYRLMRRVDVSIN